MVQIKNRHPITFTQGLQQIDFIVGNGQRQFNQRNNNNNNRRPASNSYSVVDNEIDTTGRGGQATRGQATRGQQGATAAGNGYSGPSAIGSNDPLLTAGEGEDL